ncbi:hypothetical protein [uncultured Hoeflea sp.]|uniref:hypothetical protein n=1 Tax=uncultured Hoeflea sp. TaxID=538666 RepID=UPI002610D4E0|nr:hypothetical protein [uncultured Hoeflea sp.]
MADFVAVIRKAVDNLSENTPENRSKVYDKARQAIRRQLEAINPPPTDEVIAKQLDKLDFAISEVEAEHTEALPADIDETDALMAELESMVEKSPVVADLAPETPPAPAPAATPAPPPPPAAAPAAVASPVLSPAPLQVEPAEPVVDDAATVDAPPAAAPVRPDELVGPEHDEAFGIDPAPEPKPSSGSRRDKSRGGGGVMAIVLVLFLAGVALAGWMYKDALIAMVGGATGPATETAEPASETATDPATETAAATPETSTPDEPAPEATPEIEVPETGEPGSDKFTQRLNADGSETDPGPAPGPAIVDGVEGRSVAELTDTTPADEAIAEENSADTPVAPEEASVPDSQPLGVAQKMILYEERLGQQSLEVKPGTVVWTLVSEPSGDGPDEQVIRGEINNPDKGLSALLTIKRNTDPSLPASHLVEVVFALPPEFEGGSIDQLQRIAFKQTEADQGNPLIAVPAKITQDFYMVALNDLDEARQTNIELMRQRNWIDIPVVYSNGRQALITLEKGASGTEVFNQALDAWSRATQ